jgi:hypothetical protein
MFIPIFVSAIFLHEPFDEIKLIAIAVASVSIVLVTYKKKAQSGDGTQELLDLCDYIVDGRFVLAERDLSLRFRGSRNQRILDMQKTREAGVPVLAEEYM